VKLRERGSKMAFVVRDTMGGGPAMKGKSKKFGHGIGPRSKRSGIKKTMPVTGKHGGHK